MPPVRYRRGQSSCRLPDGTHGAPKTHSPTSPGARRMLIDDGAASPTPPGLRAWCVHGARSPTANASSLGHVLAHGEGTRSPTPLAPAPTTTQARSRESPPTSASAWIASDATDECRCSPAWSSRSSEGGGSLAKWVVLLGKRCSPMRAHTRRVCCVRRAPRARRACAASVVCVIIGERAQAE